jgi:hypothetical protein
MVNAAYLSQATERQIAEKIKAFCALNLPQQSGVALIICSNPLTHNWQQNWPNMLVEFAHFPHIPQGVCAYDTIICLHPTATELEHILPTLPHLLRPDGLALLAIPARWPWGVYGTAWWGHISTHTLQRLCHYHGVQLKPKQLNCGFALAHLAQPVRQQGTPIRTHKPVKKQLRAALTSG